MTVTAKTLLEAKQLESTQTTQYTADGVTAKISKFTVTNTSSSNVSFSCNIVASGGSASSSNLIINDRSVSAGETYLCPEMTGQVISTGGFVSTIASSATSLTARISGIEIS